MDIRKELTVSDLKNVKFIAEDYSIEDSARGRKKRPAMELAKLGIGYIFSVEVGDFVEGTRRGVPNWAEEIGNFLVIEKDWNDKERKGDDEDEEERHRAAYCSSQRSAKGLSGHAKEVL